MTQNETIAKMRQIFDSRNAVAEAKKSALEAEAAPSSRLAKKVEEDSRRTDVGQAARIAREHGEKCRFVTSWNRWVAYDGKRWICDDGSKRVESLAVETARRAVAEAARAMANAAEKGDEDAQSSAKKDLAWAQDSLKARQLRAAVSLIPAVAHDLCISHERLDSDPWLLNVQNGTLDLRTGILREHDPLDLATKIAGTDFLPEAKCPTWDAFVCRVMNDDPELVSYLQRMIGYSLTGEIREHVLGFFFGGGANGKSTFMNLVMRMLGDYAARAPRGLLFRHQGSSHETNLTTLHGARFVTCAEVEEGAAFDEALVKDLTGGDPIPCRRMREDFWTYLPTHKLFLAGNHRPHVRGSDHGIWRRIRLVPFEVTIPASERDPELPAKLVAELPGILAWAVRGCLEWQKRGLGEPLAVSEATTRYREDSDPLREFFESYCTFGPAERIARKRLRERYEEYARENGAEPLGAKRFAEGLRVREVTPAKVREGTRVHDGWRGVRLKTDLERVQESEGEASC